MKLAKRSAAIFLIIVNGCTGYDDVSEKHAYWAGGWIPGHEYSLRAPMDLIHEEGTDLYYFSKWYGKAVGTKTGSIGDEAGKFHDEIVLWNGPAGTRFKITQLIRHNKSMLGSVTNGVGPLLDGPYAGTVINLFSTSADVRIERDEFINGRPSDIEEVNSNQ